MPEKKLKFVHLKLSTEYSILDSIIKINCLITKLLALKLPAIAITDSVNLFGSIKFYKACVEAGIKPIIGARLQLTNRKYNSCRKDFEFNRSSSANHFSSFTVLCQNLVGIQNLREIITYAHEQKDIFYRCVDVDFLEKHSEGLIVILDHANGEISNILSNISDSINNNYSTNDELNFAINKWKSIFQDRFYLELCRNKRSDEVLNKKIIKFSQQYNIPIVATNNVFFLEKDDFHAHEAKVCIQDGLSLSDKNREQKYSDTQYLKSANEMCDLFADIPDALKNTVEIAKMCSVILEFDKVFLPKFTVPSLHTAESFLIEKAKKEIIVRLDASKINNLEMREIYQNRLEYELNMINKMGFASYFLIVADFVGWAKANDIYVGAGRGSGAGSLVAYVLKITDIDPIEYKLIFERFLNPERVSMPDFDLDFCMDGRDRVIEYVKNKYGRDSVAQIATFGTMAAKAVIRDVGRVLDYPYGMVDKIAKLIPAEIGITLDSALKKEEELKKRYEEDEDVKLIFDMAIKLEGLVRSVGKHAGGIVITPTKLTDFTALYCEKDENNFITQLDKNDLEVSGIVKFDFLGLRTLTVMDWVIRDINAENSKNNKQEILTLDKINLEDKAVFELINKRLTAFVFQLDSHGMQDLISRLQPKNMEDLIAIGALIRPGPLQSGMVDDFIKRRHGLEKVDYLYPTLEPILKSTYGMIVYQEQVLEIARVLSGYTLGAADILRRAMGKKKHHEMQMERDKFVQGAIERNVPKNKAVMIFNLIEKFSGYGFNRSHAAAYALITYQTAWLKAHYPTEFMASVLSADMNHTEKVIRFIDECNNLNIEIISPDINRSFYRFVKFANCKVLYGLGAIKGVGDSAVQGIIEARNKLGKFKNILELCLSVDLRRINKRVLEALIKSGSFDSIHYERMLLLESVDDILKLANKINQANSYGQLSLFDSADDIDNDLESIFAKKRFLIDKTKEAEDKLLYEMEVLGLYISSHPLQLYIDEINHWKVDSFELLYAKKNKRKLVKIFGWVIGLKIKRSKKTGDKLAIINLENINGKRIDIVVYGVVFETYKNILKRNVVLMIEGDASIDEYNGNVKISCKQVFDLPKIREIFGKALIIDINYNDLDKNILQILKNVLINSDKGYMPVVINCKFNNEIVEQKLNDKYKILPNNQCMQEIANVFVKANIPATVHIKYN